jgi:flagellar basal-body rod protein FlgC
VSFAPILDQNRNGQSVGVQVRGILPDMQTPMQTLNDPSHPDANEQGLVTLPNVNVTQEMADLIGAMRAYEANLNVQDGFIRSAERALRIAQ